MVVSNGSYKMSLSAYELLVQIGGKKAACWVPCVQVSNQLGPVVSGQSLGAMGKMCCIISVSKHFR